MSSRVRTRLRRRAVGLAGALPASWLRWAVARRHGGPTLTVVLLVTDDNAVFLEECLASLDRQSRRADEILLVVTGEGADTDGYVAQHTGSWRVTVTRLRGAGRTAAWAHGARAASGELLVLGDAGRVFAPEALAGLAEPFRADGSVELSGVDVAALGRVELDEVMLRRALWARAAADLPEGPFTAWWAVAALLREARAVVARSGKVYGGPRRGTGLAFGAMEVLAPWARPWSEAVHAVLADLGPTPERREPFLHWLLDEELPRYLEDAERADEDQWQCLVATTRDLVAAAGPALCQDVRVESRVRLGLAAAGLRSELADFNVDRWLAEGQFPTEVLDGRVVAELPVDPELLPPGTLDLAAAETPAVTSLRRARWAGAAELELELYAYIDRVPADLPGATAEGWLVGGTGTRVPLTLRRRPAAEVNVVAGDRFADQSAGAFLATVDVASLVGRSPRQRWELHVRLEVAGVVREGRVLDVDLRGSAGALPARAVAGGVLSLSAPRGSDLALVVEPARDLPDAPGAEGWSLEDVRIDGGTLVLTGSAPASAGRCSWDVTGAHTAGPVAAVAQYGRFVSTVRLAHDPWRLGERPLPSGTYRLRLRDADGSPRRYHLDQALADRLPDLQRSDLYRVRLQRGPEGSLALVLAAPLRTEEVGAHAQQRLQRWYATDEHRLDPRAVYLQSYTGQAATDSPRAIHDALRRLRPDLRLTWGVADSSTSLPEGATPVVIRSREWYAALATSAHVVTNIDMDRWFVKRPGQRLLQTYHGYPSKSMGIAAWEAKNLTARRIDRQLRRTSATWDLLLTPTPAMDVHYRRQYRYDGAILAAGYPRDDALLAPSADEVRHQVRERLGLGERIAVLYAPTWRDDLATNFRAAPMASTLDVERAAEELGDDYVLLLRGHRFHRRRAGNLHHRLVDVTEYPEINDLVLASDAAVLDYSSLRFDFALTGRPMVFLVPDLDRYTGGVRGFLFDFASSAPGPLTADTDEVIAALRDIDRLRADTRDALERFNATFNDRQDGHAAERVVEAFFGAVPAPREAAGTEGAV